MPTLTSAPAIAYRNLAANLVVTSSSENPSFPSKNLGTSTLESQIWESVVGSLTSVSNIVDLGSVSSIDIVALLGFNGSDTSSRTLHLANNSSFSPLLYSTTGSSFDLTYTTHILNDTPSYGRHLLILPSSTINAKNVRLLLTDTSSPNNHLKGSVLWVGPLWQFPQGYDISTEPLGEYVGVPGVERRVKGWKLIVKGLSETDSVNIESVINTKLRSGRLILIPHPTKPSILHEVMYCTLTSYKRTYLPIISHDTPYQAEIEFREVED